MLFSLVGYPLPPPPPCGRTLGSYRFCDKHSGLFCFCGGRKFVVLLLDVDETNVGCCLSHHCRVACIRKPCQSTKRATNERLSIDSENRRMLFVPPLQGGLYPKALSVDKTNTNDVVYPLLLKANRCRRSTGILCCRRTLQSSEGPPKLPASAAVVDELRRL
jgi:hypothetical protein